tara:strand:- start:819 stop:974 length:156 start_codon:yes stop_codon:yes gene_type:complete
MKSKIEKLIQWYIEDDIPDWEGLINGLSKLGMTDSEVLAICWDVRKGGIGY